MAECGNHAYLKGITERLDLIWNVVHEVALNTVNSVMWHE